MTNIKKLQKLEATIWEFYHRKQKSWRTDTVSMNNYRKRWEKLAGAAFPENDGIDFFNHESKLWCNFSDVIA